MSGVINNAAHLRKTDVFVINDIHVQGLSILIRVRIEERKQSD